MTTVVVPMKPLSQAKRRLSAALDDGARERLAEVMLRDVLACLKASPSVSGLVVVGSDMAVAGMARDFGARFLPEERPGEGLDAAVNQAARRLSAEGTASMLYVPGDVPMAAPAEIEAVIAAIRHAPMVIVPSHDRDGTNALALSPPDLIAPAFGRGSFDRHLRLARHAGAQAKVLELPGLALDIDMPADLPRLAEARHCGDRYAFLRALVSTAELAGGAA